MGFCRRAEGDSPPPPPRGPASPGAGGSQPRPASVRQGPAPAPPLQAAMEDTRRFLDALLAG
jgi:hypothetical protein